MIRTLTENEVGLVYEMAVPFFKEAANGMAPVKEVFEASWRGFLQSGVGHLVSVVKDGKDVGSMGYLIHPDTNDGVLCGVEIFWYVLPEYRGGGLHLIRYFEEDCKKRGCGRLTVNHLTSFSHANQLTRLYERLGYRASEITFTKQLQ